MRLLTQYVCLVSLGLVAEAWVSSASHKSHSLVKSQRIGSTTSLSMGVSSTLRRVRDSILSRERTREDLWGYCKTCYYGDVCKAGCSWTSYCLFDKAGNNPYCIHRVSDLESKGIRERIVRIEAAPGVPFDNGKFELIQEPMPPVAEDHVPMLSGIDLSEVIKVRPTRSSVWTKEEMKKTLEKT